MRPSALFLLVPLALAATAPRASTPVDVGSRKQLFLDDRVVQEIRGGARVWNTPAKYPNNPVLRGDRPWENWVAYPDGGPVVLHDQDERVFKMWYQTFFDDPATPRYDQKYLMCYATSQDGLRWEKPDLGLFDWNGSRANNIVAVGNTGLIDTNVIKDPRDPDPARRYKVLYYDTKPGGGPLGISVGFSPDGIRWNLHPGNPVLVGTGDTHTLLGWDESAGKYIAYLRPKSNGARRYGEGGDRVRVIGRSTSDDFLRWTMPAPVLAPDASDLPGTQFYGMPVFRYEDHYIGVLWIYHAVSQLVYNQLAWSRDGIHWQRPPCRPTFLAVGAEGTWEDGMSYATTPIVRGDQILIYYGGFNVLHNLATQKLLGSIVDGKRREGATGLARLRLDGFASIDAALDVATVTTPPLRFQGSRLFLNLAPVVGGGGPYDELAAFHVEISDAGGRAIPGFTFEDSDDLKAGGTRVAVAWKRNPDLSSLAGRTVVLRFRFRNAKFYAFQFQ
jgi:hypothetical protein